MTVRANQIPLSFPVTASMAREDFLVSDCNREALAWIDRAPNWNAPLLYIYGPTGSGKTHLANIWKRASGGEVIDGIESIVGNHEQEEALFHLYNRVRQIPGSVLMTGALPLALVKFSVPDLASRLRACPQVALGLPDENLLRALLVKLFSDRQMRIDVGLIEYCVSRMERSFEAARNLVARLDQMSLTQKRAINTAMVREILNPEQNEFFAV